MADDTVTMRCPECGLEQPAERDQLDPAEARIVVLLCPDCNGGDFGVPSFLRADGTEVMWDE